MALTQPPTVSFWRSFRFPLIVLFLFGAIFASPWICVALGRDDDSIAPFFLPAIWLSPAAAILLISLWWFFFSGFGWGAKLGVFALGVAFVAGLVATVNMVAIRQVELTMSPVGLIPLIHFKWDPTPEEKLAQHLEKNSGNTDDLPKIDATVGPEDFASYRGPKLDGVVPYAKLQTDWQKNPPTTLWRQPCPGGYGGVAVAGNIVVTLQQRGAQEVVVCYDRATGRQRWIYAYDAHYQDSMGNGPRSTPTIHKNLIFTIGATGEMVCLDVEGVKQWSVNILQDAQATNIKWGMTGSPLIVEDMVIAHAGINPKAPAGSALIAYEQTTGEKRWKTGNRKAGYSSPQLATLGGSPQILLFDGAGLVSYDPKTAKELWQFPWITDWEMNSIQPVVVGADRVFISSELKNGCALLRVTEKEKGGWSVEPMWNNKNLAARYANPVTDGKHIFGLHSINGVLTCLSVSDGSVQWKGERHGPGQLLLAGNVLLVVSGDKGELALFDADATTCNELARHPIFDKKTWNTPALAGDQLFVRNQEEIICLQLARTVK